MSYETDEEKVEAIKKWWEENGRAVIVGVIVGLAVILGWRAWTGYRDGLAQRASAAYEQLLATVAKGDAETALAQSKLLAEEFSSTTYATLAALLQARSEVELGNLEGARAALERVVAKSPDPAITKVAALRLARVLIAQGDLDAAEALVERHDEGASFAGAFAAVRGEIQEARGNTAEARAAYEAAIAAGAPDPQLLRLKLDALPPVGAPGAEDGS